MSILPYRTSDLPGVGGRIKVEPEDFLVEEIPAYRPSGEGDHLYLWIEKRDLSHEFLLRHLARALDVSPRDIGTAGIKDRRAVTRQWISVPRSAESRLAQLDLEGLRVLQTAAHTNKLKTGHLKGNRFRILIRDTEGDVLSAAERIAETLRLHGFPNYYGGQRFGRDGDTLQAGWRLLTGNVRPRRRDSRLRLQLSAVQSHLFNECLRRRIDDGLLDRVLLGDVMQVVESGGLFVVEDETTEQSRATSGETVVTGPLFGPKMKAAEGEVAVREATVLTESGLRAEDFERFKKLTRGARRAYLIRPDVLAVESVESGILVRVTLPPGSYATVLLRELMKGEDNSKFVSQESSS